MSILLTHCYYLADDIKEQKIMKPYPPLGLLYIAAYLSEKGIANQVCDSTFETRDGQLRAIAAAKPQLVAIYTNLMTKIEVIRLIKMLLADARFGFPTIVLGGPDVTFNCENYLKAGAHFLVIGEGEETMHA